MSSQSPTGPPSETPSAPTHEKTTTPGTPSPRPEMMFGLWTSWVESISKLASDMKTAPEGLPGQAAWQMSPDQLTSGLKQLGDMAAKDSILASILRATDDALNANPLRQLIPVDWAEIARALRTIWLRTISRPESAMAAAADFSMRQGQATVDTWNEAWQRWCGLARPEPAASGGADKRFAAPEWQGNPVYRTLKELYLLASDWLLRQASEADDLSPAEREHLEFHLRQFVDATSPTLLLASNPVALRRAVETGGASLAEGMRNLMHDLKEGRLSMVDAEAFAPGRNLALSPGKVVYRNKLIELIHTVPAKN
jgi:poly[(R)-3-hydroxyalkanoate] polymerase subunit PhaC